MTLFHRDYKLQVGTLEVSNLDATFKVHKSIKAEPNKAEISIRNLSADHRAELARHRRAGAEKQPPITVQLEAGYLNSRSVIFRGDLRYGETKRDGADFVTSLLGADAGHAYQTARVNQSFGPGTTVQAVIRACASAMGVGVGNLDAFANAASLGDIGKSFTHGHVLSGRASAELDALCRAAEYEWSIQHGVLQFKPKNKPMEGAALRLAPESGLIGSPSAVAATAETGKKKPDAKQVKCQVLMIAGIYAGRKVVLDSADFKGGYEVAEAEYVGDTAGTDWQIDLMLRPY